jgi:S1-C subfamily serine protease
MLKWEDVTRMATRLKGVPVLGCRPGSPSARAGVQYGDILMVVNGMATPDWGSYIEARALSPGHMRVEVFRAGDTLTMEFDMPAHGEPIDLGQMLDDLIESGLVPPPIGGDPRREPAPS